MVELHYAYITRISKLIINLLLEKYLVPFKGLILNGGKSVSECGDEYRNYYYVNTAHQSNSAMFCRSKRTSICVYFSNDWHVQAKRGRNKDIIRIAIYALITNKCMLSTTERHSIHICTSAFSLKKEC